jgi:hypothetical protein
LIRTGVGDLEEGVRYLEEAISISQDGGLPFILHRAQRDMAEIELVLGQAVKAQVRLPPIAQSPGCEQYNDITPPFWVSGSMLSESSRRWRPLGNSSLTLQ